MKRGWRGEGNKGTREGGEERVIEDEERGGGESDKG